MEQPSGILGGISCVRVVFQRQERQFVLTTRVLLEPEFDQFEISSLGLVVEPAKNSQSQLPLIEQELFSKVPYPQGGRPTCMLDIVYFSVQLHFARDSLEGVTGPPSDELDKPVPEPDARVAPVAEGLGLGAAAPAETTPLLSQRSSPLFQSHERHPLFGVIICVLRGAFPETIYGQSLDTAILLEGFPHVALTGRLRYSPPCGFSNGRGSR